MSSRQLNTNSSQGPKNINQNLHSNKYRPLAPKPSVPKVLAPRPLAPRLTLKNTPDTHQEASISYLTPKPSTQALPKLMTPALVRPNISESYSLMTGQVVQMRNNVNNVVAEPTTLLTNATSLTMARSNNYYLSHDTNDNFLFHQENDDSFQHNFNDNAFNTELDYSGYQDHNAKENVNLEEMKNSKKRKASDDKSQAWSDEETCKLLDFLEDNFSKYQKGKKSEFYAMVSRNIIKTKSAESIKGRLSRLLEKYSKVKRQNNQSGSERVDWKWMEKMDRIFGCRENVSPSHISNETTEYINDEINEPEEVPNPEKDDKKVVKRKKNNVESLIDVMSNISEKKAKISEQRLELEREKMNNDFKLKMEKFEIEKKKWEFEREQSKMLHELTMKKLELQMQRNN